MHEGRTGDRLGAQVGNVLRACDVLRHEHAARHEVTEEVRSTEDVLGLTESAPPAWNQSQSVPPSCAFWYASMLNLVTSPFVTR